MGESASELISGMSMRLHRNKDTITLLGLPDKMQNDTNTSIEWDVLLVNFICCLSEIQIEL